jgi:hypothetical protein
MAECVKTAELERVRPSCCPAIQLDCTWNQKATLPQGAWLFFSPSGAQACGSVGIRLQIDIISLMKF